jgi:hypothetical protein
MGARRQRKQQEQQGQLVPDLHITPRELVDHVEGLGDEAFKNAEHNLVDALALAYFNTGVHQYGQHRQFQLPAAKPEDIEEEVLLDLEKDKLHDDDIQHLVAAFKKAHNYYPKSMPGCGCCGSVHNMANDGIMQYHEVEVQSLPPYMKYTDEQLRQLACNKKVKVVIPVDEHFATQEVAPHDVRSCYRLHRELDS